MKITNKFLPVLAGLAILSTLIIGCKKDQPEDEPYGITIDTQKDEDFFRNTYTLLVKVPDTEAEVTEENPNPTKKWILGPEYVELAKTYGITIEPNKITLNPVDEVIEIYISGYFKGQIVNDKKNTILNLDGVYLENDAGPVITAEKGKDLEIVANVIKNYVITTAEDTNAIDVKDLKLGGKYTCYIVGTKHGLKGSDVKFKGSGTYYIQGAAQVGDDENTGGSAINCKNFTIEEGKEVKIYAINSKNGIKADSTISIAGGTVNLLNNTTALKTDLTENDPKNPHSITLSGGKIYDCKNKTFYITDEGKYVAADGVVEKVEALTESLY